MIVGLILAGGVMGGMSALTMLILGHSVWMALLLYSAVGALSVLVGASVLALRADPEDQIAPIDAYPLPRAGRL